MSYSYGPHPDYHPTRNPTPCYRLTRDGQEIMTGTEQEIWAFLHRHASYSVHWGLQFEGWKIAPHRP